MAKSLTQPYLQIADESPVIIERSVTPRGEIQLQRRGPHYEIISNGDA
ncbi:hypothetical protein [Cohnella pontilimi]|nr:hypothetical protein [Cohnella pontilimi]